eukprot:1367526-Ditylum_brightwellii.AAC.1
MAGAVVMEDADALQINRDAHAPDPGGVGVGTTITRIGAQYRQQSSSWRKNGLLYDIISRKKKRCTRGSTKKRTQQQQNITRQFLAPAPSLEPNAEIEITVDVNELHHNTTNTNENNQQQYKSTDNVDCRGGDKID